MSYKRYLVPAIFAAALAYDAKTHIKNRSKIRALEVQNELLAEMREMAKFQLLYIASELERCGITLDEFDMIILNNPMY